ncbi:MAG: hypothetical protein LE169_03865 [Endomicrobium sp.]|nr:hypothetical protein [Endomicrobium sp.]MCA6080009.1 hypothetical protein [Endomicrobium sp.]
MTKKDYEIIDIQLRLLCDIFDAWQVYHKYHNPKIYEIIMSLSEYLAMM